MLAVEQGLDIPLVYNSCGYDSVETLSLLDGILDIYMPDMKYSDNNIAWRLSGIEHYTDISRKAVSEMYRQVGDLQFGSSGTAYKGLLIRNLILPGGLAGIEEIMHFLALSISPDTYTNIMDQYHPCYKAYGCDKLNMQITKANIRILLMLLIQPVWPGSIKRGPGRNCGSQSDEQLK